MIQAINTSIDTVQGTKTLFLNTFVKDEAFRKPLQSFVDAQTFFAKSMVDIADELSKAVSKYDYSKAFSFAK